MILPADNGRYFNHSKIPNTQSRYPKNQDVPITRALRNIERGEELTDDYGNFETGWTDDYFDKQFE